ncbi:MAG TPA: preprotein translocase subunit YajC [Pirellulales bacterium]
MSISLIERFVILAQQGEQQPQGWLTIVPYLPILLIVVLYMLLIQRPQRREQAVRQALLKSLKKNDRVVTSSGIYGVVTSVQVDADEVTIRVDEATNTKLRMRLASIAHVLGTDTTDKDIK